MGTVETRSSKTLTSSPESETTKSPNEKALKVVNESLTENNSGSVIEGLLGGVTQENGVKTDSGEKNEIKITSIESVSGEEEEKNGVSLVENEIKANGSVSESEDVEQGHEFGVGDFVWGKIKSHPWWPGQIYDPSQASDFAAAKMRHGGSDHHHLVAYFGDGTFAWCRPSQLKPFNENFLAMSRQSNARGFAGAVHRAVDKIAGALELSLTCSCVPESNRVGLGRSVAENSGVKEGSLVPEGKIRKLSDYLSEPSELLSVLRRIALDVHGVSQEVVELGILRTRVSAFYRSKGVCELPRYLDPVPILGLEDKEKKSNLVEVPAQGPFEDWLPEISQADRPLLQSCQIGLESKRTPRRKQRSIADLIAGEGTSSEEKEKTKLTSESREAKESSGGSKGKKSKKKEKGIVENEEESFAKPQFEKSPSFREKKKSKYLSPPFTVTDSSKKKSKESETELPEVSTPKDVGPKTSGDKNSHQEKKADVSTNEVLSEVRSTAANPLSQREKDSVEMVVDFMSAFRGSVYSDGSNPQSRKRKKRKSPESESVVKDPNNDEKKRKSPESKSGGKDPNDQKKRKSLESKSGGKDPNDQKKRKSLESKSGGKDPKDEKIKSPESKSGRKDPDVHSEGKQSVKTRGRKRKQETPNPEETISQESKAEGKNSESKPRKKKQKKVETREEIIEEKILPATLIVEFAPASTLPTKSDLIKMYGKYGELDEVKTDMYYNNQCARIYFLNGSNAESAYKDSKSSSPFGSNSVEFVLECPSREYKTRVLNEITPTKQVAVETPKKKKVSKSKSKENGGLGLGFVKRKLERISKMLEGKISENLRSKLKEEVSGLLEKVNAMVASSSN